MVNGRSMPILLPLPTLASYSNLEAMLGFLNQLDEDTTIVTSMQELKRKAKHQVASVSEIESRQQQYVWRVMISIVKPHE